MDRCKYVCKPCNKNYASYQSLWLHNKKYHSDSKDKTSKKVIKCDKCKFTCNEIGKLQTHNQTDCRPSINSNNIYTFKTDTLGRNKYEKGGDIYIIQTEFELKGYYKIGYTTNLYDRIGHYRCGAVLEPKLHFYYPCKNIKEADVLLKKKLKKFNIKREIYKCDNLQEIRDKIKEVQREMNCKELEITPEIKECEIQPCNFCDLHFTNKQDLKLHCLDKHNEILKEDNNNKIYGCRYCDKEYKHRQTRYTHELTCEVENKKKGDRIQKLENEMMEIKKQFTELNTTLQKILITQSKKQKTIEI